ncbi:MAG: hypothetical protein FWD06_02175 [Oscillospiraceae bacterium]|nr:hypothetical protein [Oscillospiraceae bacterium]
MTTTHVDFNSFKVDKHALAQQTENGLLLSAEKNLRSSFLPTKPLTSCVTMPKTFRLPLCIHMTVHMPQPALHLLLGEGHLSFGTQSDNRSISDIVEPDRKPKHFNNHTDLAKDNEITVLYGLKFMQIIVNGETRYFSKREKYMRSDIFADMNKAGFELKIGTDKFAELMIKNMTVEEYDVEPDAVPINNEIDETRLYFIRKGVKAGFEECISLLAPALQAEIIKADQFLLSEKELKIKRKIEGDQLGCKITYISSVHGFSYSLRINEHLMSHSYWWYMVSNYKYEGKFMGRKNDLTNSVLKRVYELSPEIAERLVSYYGKCTGCSQSCAVKTVYELNGKKFVSCHGSMHMNMNLQTFSDFRFMLDVQKDML